MQKREKVFGYGCFSINVPHLQDSLDQTNNELLPPIYYAAITDCIFSIIFT